MAKSEPFLVYETQCEKKTSGAHKNPDVRWWTLVSADRRPSAACNTGSQPLRLLYALGVDSSDEVEYHFATKAKPRGDAVAAVGCSLGPRYALTGFAFPNDQGDPLVPVHPA